MSNDNVIATYYNDHCIDEEYRLNIQSTEYLVTKKLISNIIKERSKILDIGGGTGVYALPLSLEGHDVTLVDLSKKELEIASRKADAMGCSIQILEGNALTFNDGILYDTVLCLGPMYHCSSIEEVKLIINNILNQLKTGGYAIFSFVSKYAKFNRFINEINIYDKQEIPRIKESLRFRIQEDNPFIFETRGKLPISLVEPMLLYGFFDSFGVDVIEILAIDLCNHIKEFNNDIFDILCTLGKGYMINNGEHVMSILQKR